VFPLVDTVRHLVSRHVTSMQISDYLISNLQMFILYQEFFVPEGCQEGSQEECQLVNCVSFWVFMT
jgi:hypothetical protein